MEKPISKFVTSVREFMATVNVPTIRQMMQVKLDQESAEDRLLALCTATADREAIQPCIDLTRLLGHGTWKGLPALSQICTRGEATREDVMQIINEAPALLRSPQYTLFLTERKRIPWQEFKEHLVAAEDVPNWQPKVDDYPSPK